MQRVLVTGASGYIGQHLVKSLLEEGVTVRGFARSAKPTMLFVDEWHQGDIRRLADVERSMQDCDTIVHLACSPLGPSWQDPIDDFQVNASGTVNILHAARKANIRRIVYGSTAQVYGSANHLPISERAPTKPASPYAASKLCGETMSAAFAQGYGLSPIILRLFNVYGLAVDGTERPTVEAIFLRHVSQGRAPVIKAHPDEGRDFIHISDVVRAIRLALATKTTHEILNIGTGVLTTLPELARLAIRISKSNLSPVIEGTDAQPTRLQADTQQAKKVLGFEAKVSLAEGLSQMSEANRLN